jgi:phosphoribosyl-AMP cyclohydrolase
METEKFLNEIKFDDRGLIVAVTQDYITNEVLMVAYMNREALAITLKEKRACYYSRSRNCLWRKGETSGHVQLYYFNFLPPAVKKPPCSFRILGGYL